MRRAHPVRRPHGFVICIDKNRPASSICLALFKTGQLQPITKENSREADAIPPKSTRYRNAYRYWWRSRTPTGLVSESLTLEEVVVTARRRSENMQQVPIAVSVISGQELGFWGSEDRYDR